MQWLLEPEVFQNDLDPFIQALTDLAVAHTVVKFGTPYEHYIKAFKDDCVAFQGSLQLAKLLQNKTTWKGVFCNLPALECQYYYPIFGKHLLNHNAQLLPFAQLNKSLFDQTGSHLFIRPSSAYKTFPGKVVPADAWDRELKLLSLRIMPQALVMVAPAVDISREWRLVVVKGKVIAGCQYKQHGGTVRIKEVPEEVIAYAQSIVDAVGYEPDPAWTLDICEADGLKVLEVGSFSCAGLYVCDPRKVISAIKQLVDLPQT